MDVRAGPRGRHLPLLLQDASRPLGRRASREGTRFVDTTPVWGLTETGEARYPWRFEAEAIVALDPTLGILGAEVAEELEFLAKLKHWGTYLQRSLNSVPDKDGKRLLEWLQQPRKPQPIAVGKPKKAKVSTAEPTLLDAEAIEASPAPETPEEEPAEAKVHTEIQGKLRDIGLFEGFDVWVADRGVVWNGAPLGSGCLTDLPLVAAEATRAVMRRIDVIWFRKGTGHPERFFEVENSTSVYSGLLRFNDVIIDFPIPGALIVGDGDKTKARFERQIARRTFEHSGLRAVTRFLFYAQVRQMWQKYAGLGGGSEEWFTDPATPVLTAVPKTP
jgi:hypothetical protein